MLALLTYSQSVLQASQQHVYKCLHSHLIYNLYFKRLNKCLHSSSWCHGGCCVLMKAVGLHDRQQQCSTTNLQQVRFISRGMCAYLLKPLRHWQQPGLGWCQLQRWSRAEGAEPAGALALKPGPTMPWRGAERWTSAPTRTPAQLQRLPQTWPEHICK